MTFRDAYVGHFYNSVTESWRCLRVTFLDAYVGYSYNSLTEIWRCLRVTFLEFYMRLVIVISSRDN